MKRKIAKIMSLVLILNMIFGGGRMVSAQNIPSKNDANIKKTYPRICLDIDDFDTREEYEQYVRETGDTSAQYPNPSTLAGVPDISITATSSDYGATATKRYTLKGLRYALAIQKAYIGSTYVYVLQRSGKDMYLSRCTISGSSATYKDEMKLTNFGHSQTLEWFEYGGIPYFWIGCKESDDTTQYWSTQVGRLEYKAGTTVDYTAIKRLSSIIKANKDGKANGTIKRSDAALSSDKSILLVWSRNTENVMQFTFYNAAKINAALSSSSSKYVSCDSSAIKSACISSFKMNNTFLPDGSCQGLEVSDAKSIYMASGANNEKKWIFKLNSTGSVTGKVYMKNADLASGTNTEIEGLQLSGDNVYFGLCNHNKKASGEQYIYSVPKSVF